jgi:hypothetical protein
LEELTLKIKIKYEKLKVNTRCKRGKMKAFPLRYAQGKDANSDHFYSTYYWNCSLKAQEK